MIYQNMIYNNPDVLFLAVDVVISKLNHARDSIILYQNKSEQKTSPS